MNNYQVNLDNVTVSKEEYKRIEEELELLNAIRNKATIIEVLENNIYNHRSIICYNDDNEEISTFLQRLKEESSYSTKHTKEWYLDKMTEALSKIKNISLWDRIFNYKSIIENIKKRYITLYENNK